MNPVTRRRFKPLVIIWCFLFITLTNCDNKVSEDHSSIQGAQGAGDKSVDSKPNKNLATSEPTAAQKPDSTPDKSDLKKIPAGDSNVSVSTNGPIIPNPEADNVGATTRAAFVFLGLSVIVIAYIIFRCARLNKNRTQMVRKYGVLAHRQDVEMRPLPLDEEDDDDTTVFDVSEVGVHNKPRRNK